MSSLEKCPRRISVLNSNTNSPYFFKLSHRAHLNGTMVVGGICHGQKGYSTCVLVQARFRLHLAGKDINVRKSTLYFESMEGWIEP